MNPIEKIQERKLKQGAKLLTPRTVNNEVQEYKDRLQSYGVKNKTVKQINKSLSEINKEKEDIGKQAALDILIKEFSPFSVVEYKTLNDVCKDHKLVISSIGNYEKAIPDENIEEIDIFVDRLKEMDKKVLSKVTACKNESFTFDDNKYLRVTSYNEWQDLIGTEMMFKIAAPKSHFSLPKDHIRIGNEYHSIGKIPKFTYTPKFNKPNFELDPIVFMSISFLNKIYCVIITAWDKEADDSRILSKI